MWKKENNHKVIGRRNSGRETHEVVVEKAIMKIIRIYCSIFSNMMKNRIGEHILQEMLVVINAIVNRCNFLSLPSRRLELLANSF